MVIYRGALPSDDFAIVPNHWFRDPRLSGKAKGYMGYIATHDKGYRLTVEQMIAEMKESRDAVYAGLDELVTLDYLERVQNNAQVTAKGRKGFGEVDYHFGPAAYEQQYERNWGWDRDGKGSCKTAGQRASGKSVNGRNQGERGVSAGQSASGKSGSAKPGSANPDTKKTTPSEDQGLEDQKKNPPPPPAQRPAPDAETPTVAAVDEPTATPAVAAEGGDSLLDDQTRNAINDAVDAAAAVRTGAAGWSVNAIRRAVRDALDAGHPVDQVLPTLATFASDPPTVTRFPGRIRAYLDERARQAAAAADAPPPVWAEPAMKHLDPKAPRCKQHPQQPKDACGSCKADSVVEPFDSGPQMSAADAIALIRATNAQAAAARRAAAVNAADRQKGLEMLDLALQQVTAEEHKPA